MFARVIAKTKVAIVSVLQVGLCLAASIVATNAQSAPTSTVPVTLMGNRFLTLNTVIRVHQIEVTRDTAHGADEASVHTPAEARMFREAIEKAWPGGRITWAMSWLALHNERESYRELRGLVASYQKQYGDEVTFIPGAYFANMYNSREQVNRDLHEGLKKSRGDGRWRLPTQKRARWISFCGSVKSLL